MTYEQYKHKGEKLFVRSDLKGREEEFSLCTNCKTVEDGCDEQDMLAMGSDIEFVAIVWACPDFFPKGAKKVLQFEGEEFELR